MPVKSHSCDNWQSMIEENKTMGTQIRFDEDLKLGGLGVHPRRQPTELGC